MNQLASKLYRKHWDDFSKETIHSAKLVLIDTIAALAAGMQQPSTLKLAEYLQHEEAGAYHVIASSYKTTLYNAAMIHGTAAVSTEMDEGNQWSKGHPAAHVVPTMLTYVQKKQDYTGKQLLILLIKAYEACSRFGRATTLLPEAHAHGTWGVMGSAATALLLENVTEEQFIEGINLSATFALPTMWSSALEGKLIRNIYVGHAIEMGMKSVAFLQSNHTAPSNNYQYVFSKVIGTAFNEVELEMEENEIWDIERNYFKPYAFCRYAHAPLDAFKKIITDHPIHPDHIDKVMVYTYSRAATLSSQQVDNVLSAKFSIPYAIAIWMYTNKADHSVFSDDLLQNQAIPDFAKKVHVVCSEDLDMDYPRIMPAVVEITNQMGKIYTERVDIASGGPDKKLTEQHIIDKFFQTTSEVFSEKQQQQIVEWVLHMEEKTNANDLISLCLHSD